MRKMLFVLAVAFLLAGCGSSARDASAPGSAAAQRYSLPTEAVGTFNGTIVELMGDSKNTLVYVGVAIDSPGYWKGRSRGFIISESDRQQRGYSVGSFIRVYIDHDGLATPDEY